MRRDRSTTVGFLIGVLIVSAFLLVTATPANARSATSGVKVGRATTTRRTTTVWPSTGPAST